MNFKDRIAEAREQERLSQIKLEENKVYNAEIIDAIYTKQKNTNYECVQLMLKTVDQEIAGKIITKLFVIDENTKNKLQGVIGLQQLIKFLKSFNLTFEDDKSLVLALLELKGKQVKIQMKKVVDKNDNTKVFTNYDFVLE